MPSPEAIRCGQAFAGRISQDPEALNQVRSILRRCDAVVVPVLQEAWQRLKNDLEARHFPSGQSVDDWLHLARIAKIPESEAMEMPLHEFVLRVRAWSDRKRIKAKYAQDARDDREQIRAKYAQEADRHDDPVYLGNSKVQVGKKVITLTDTEGEVLQALVKLRSANIDELGEESGADKNAPRYLRAICDKHPELGKHITLPGGKGKGGYRTTIRAARSGIIPSD